MGAGVREGTWKGGREGGREGGKGRVLFFCHKHACVYASKSLPKTAFMASSFVQVITSCRQEEGRREFLCFFRRWRTWTWF